MIDDKCSGIATAEEQNLEAERFIEELDASQLHRLLHLNSGTLSNVLKPLKGEGGYQS